MNYPKLFVITAVNGTDTWDVAKTSTNEKEAEKKFFNIVGRSQVNKIEISKIDEINNPEFQGYALKIHSEYNNYKNVTLDEYTKSANEWAKKNKEMIFTKEMLLELNYWRFEWSL